MVKTKSRKIDAETLVNYKTVQRYLPRDGSLPMLGDMDFAGNKFYFWYDNNPNAWMSWATLQLDTGKYLDFSASSSYVKFIGLLLDMNSNKIQNVPDPTAAQDAATKNYVDSNIITDHGALTGLTDDDHTQYLLADGTRALAGDLNLNSHKITNVTDPVNDQDADTKAARNAAISTHATITDAHHTRYTDAEARASIGDLIDENSKLLKELDINSQKIYLDQTNLPNTYIWEDGTDPIINFDDGDQLLYDISANQFLFKIGGTTELSLSATELKLDGVDLNVNNKNLNDVASIDGGGNAVVFNDIIDVEAPYIKINRTGGNPYIPFFRDSAHCGSFLFTYLWFRGQF